MIIKFKLIAKNNYTILCNSIEKIVNMGIRINKKRVYFYYFNYSETVATSI